MENTTLGYFQEFMEIPASGATYQYLLGHPVLLSPAAWTTIARLVVTLPPADQQKASSRLDLLTKIYDLFSDFDKYPWGDGPLEKIHVDCINGQLSLSSACQLAKDKKIYSRLSPIYIGKVCNVALLYARRNETEWDKSRQLVSIALSSVDAIDDTQRDPEEWLQMQTDLVAAFIDVTTLALIQVPDKRMLTEAAELGEELIRDAETRQDVEAVAATANSLGLLYLDPWFSGKSSSQYRTQFIKWQSRVFDYYGSNIAAVDTATILMPSPEEAVQKSITYLEKALTITEAGPHVHLIKALTEAYMWNSIVHDSGNFDDAIAMGEMTLSLCVPEDRYEALIVSMNNTLAFCRSAEPSGKTTGAVMSAAPRTSVPPETPAFARLEKSELTESHPSGSDKALATAADRFLEKDANWLIQHYGYSELFYQLAQLITPLLKQDVATPLVNQDLLKAQQLWIKADRIITEEKLEDFAETYYQLGVRVLSASFPADEDQEENIPTSQLYQTAKEKLAAGLIPPASFYARALLLAAVSTTKDQEAEGLAILKEIEAEAFKSREMGPWVSLFNFLAANLYGNLGASEWNNHIDEKAIEDYFTALRIFLDLGYPRHVQTILQRIEEINDEGIPLLRQQILAKMTSYALSIESVGKDYLSDTCQRLYRQILLGIRADPKVNPVELAYVFQLAKGYKYNALLQLPARLGILQDSAIKNTLATIDSLFKELPGNTGLQSRHFIDDEYLLVSYADNAEPRDGATLPIRLENSKNLFDQRIYRQLLPETSEKKDVIYNPGELMALLSPDTVLISLLLAPAPNGDLALYYLILTSEEEYFISGSLEGVPSSIIEMEREGLRIRIPFLGMNVVEARKYIQKDPETEGLYSKAAQSLELLSQFIFAKDVVDLLDQLAQKGRRHLCIWPHGPLHYYPFHLLPVAGKPLCETWQVSYLPSIGVLERSGRPQAGKDAAISGTAVMAGAGADGKLLPISVLGITFLDNNPYEFLGPLPDSVSEATAIAGIFGVDPLTEEAVTEESFVDALLHSKWVHLSTHGLFDATAPSFHCLCLHAGEKSDGILNAYELLEYDFRHVKLLTLSACETALGRFDAGDNMRGLPAMFLKAGVRTIVGTLWNAESQSCECFFVSLYTSLKQGKTKSDAFEIAQKKTRAEYPDYRDWGAFFYMGER